MFSSDNKIFYVANGHYFAALSSQIQGVQIPSIYSFTWLFIYFFRLNFTTLLFENKQNKTKITSTLTNVVSVCASDTRPCTWFLLLAVHWDLFLSSFWYYGYAVLWKNKKERDYVTLKHLYWLWAAVLVSVTVTVTQVSMKVLKTLLNSSLEMLKKY